MESADATRGSSVAAPTHAEGYALDAARRPLAPHVSYDRLRSLKVTVDAAIKEHHIFSVAGQFPVIRQALKQRGWLEKSSTLMARKKKLQAMKTADGNKINTRNLMIVMPPNLDQSLEDLDDPFLVSRLLRNSVPDLLWALRSDTVDWRGLARWQLVNRFPKALFTTKVGLCAALQHMQWFTEEGVSETFFPRCYCVSHLDEMFGFVNDFRITACYSLLRHLLEPTQEQTMLSLVPIKQIYIPPKAAQFAVSRTKEHNRHLRHEDVDDPEISLKVWDCEWDQFLTYYYQAVHEHALVAWDSPQQQEDIESVVKDILEQFGAMRPQSSHDGVLNLWIVKPGARSCGRGIQVMNRLETIMARTQPTAGKEARFVVQKYIERPMLIYKTKFDIRQWFLITCAQPLTIWMYRESYLRFCSQIFDMRNLHESVHLSNNAVQCRYQNCERDSALPEENMWDCYTFQTYLRSIGKAEAWEEIVYPGMRAGIIGAMLASQDWLQDCQKNCFELYGADFMLTEGDLLPWLIEVNCSPCMAPSTSVTARMCAQCLEDVLKVVVDRRDDKDAPTGMFELVYKQNSPPAPPYQGVALGVKGRRMMATKPKKRRRRHKKRPEGGESSLSSSETESSDEDENKLNLVGRHRVSMDSPLKVVKADLNAPIKKKPAVPLLFNFDTLNGNGGASKSSSTLVASELRNRLELLLVEETVNKSQSRPSSSIQMQTSHSSRPQSATSPKNKSTKKSGKSSLKFKGKVSGKIMTVVQRSNDVKLKPAKLRSENPPVKRKTKSAISKQISSIETSTEKEDEASDAKNEELQQDETEEPVDPDNLMLQPDNLRSTKIKLLSTANENSEYFKDPSRSLALVKEWRKRLEVTRASCEQMLEQLKAFRDPPTTKSSLLTMSTNTVYKQKEKSLIS